MFPVTLLSLSDVMASYPIGVAVTSCTSQVNVYKRSGLQMVFSCYSSVHSAKKPLAVEGIECGSVV